jgi:hypothetical protein
MKASIASAEKTKSGAVDAATSTYQGAVASYPLPGFPTGNAAYKAALKAADAARIAALDSAERTKQSAVAAAQDTLRATGEANIEF